MSSESEIAVRVRGLGKSYTIAHQAERHVTLTESLLARARHPLARAPSETFWALKDVDFDIHQGDVVGIIGRNGAGKSTLLKILSRITEPTAGQIELYGRVGSLLEVGTGFHPELTGRENVFLNGAILGMTKAEIRRQFDAIVEFSGVSQFLDTPVKRYSSGMYVRLAFAVAAHLESEILIVDEVLAVGDAAFQRKCIGTMRDVANTGRTVLIVSHDLGVIRTLGKRAIRIEKGSIIADGAAPDVCDRFILESLTRSDPSDLSAFRKRQTPSTSIQFSAFTCQKYEGRRSEYSLGDSITITATIQSDQAVDDCSWIFLIKDEFGTVISSHCAEDTGHLPRLAVGTNILQINIPDNPLLPGKYIGDLRIAPRYRAITWDWLENIPFFEIANTGITTVNNWLDRPGRLLLKGVSGNTSHVESTEISIS